MLKKTQCIWHHHHTHLHISKWETVRQSLPTNHTLTWLNHSLWFCYFIIAAADVNELSVDAASLDGFFFHSLFGEYWQSQTFISLSNVFTGYVSPLGSPLKSQSWCKDHTFLNLRACLRAELQMNNYEFKSRFFKSPHRMLILTPRRTYNRIQIKMWTWRLIKVFFLKKKKVSCSWLLQQYDLNLCFVHSPSFRSAPVPPHQSSWPFSWTGYLMDQHFQH